MKDLQYIKFRLMFGEELRKAQDKHPKFCDTFTLYSKSACVFDENAYKKRNKVAPYKADDILLEEVCEARTAYVEGDKAHCLQGLAQCGAVILRMMEFVSNEMETKDEV